jgi:antitoxin (DNA-binding transcriptional repressor) of toxin-antitoxin stability system
LNKKSISLDGLISPRVQALPANSDSALRLFSAAASKGYKEFRRGQKALRKPRSSKGQRCPVKYDWDRQYNPNMGKEVIHISEQEAASDFRSLLTRVRAGAEIIIEDNSEPVAVVHRAQPVRRSISECIALLPENSVATIDPDFAKDVEMAIDSHREALNPPAWD